jgi:hypothetical protein
VAWNLLIDPAVTINSWFFTLNGADINTSSGGTDFGPGSIVYTAPPAPGVPEPSTWILMIVGFATMGFMAYRWKSEDNGEEAI